MVDKKGARTMKKHLSIPAGLVLACSAAVSHAEAIVGGEASFVATRAQLERADDAPCHPLANDASPVCLSAISDSHAAAGDPAGAYAEVRAAYGDSGAYASVSASQVDLEAYAESIWADAFVVSGGTGAGTLHLNVRVDGTVDGAGQPGGPGSNAFYVLFASDAPITCDFDEVDCTGTRAIALTEPLSGTRFLQADIVFTYDVPFYLASYLGAEVVGGLAGVADFFHSAHLGIGAPAGATLTTTSGTVYPSTVPEPAALAMVLAGALLAWGAPKCAFMGRRRA
jgi:hypothetical protein